MTIAQELASFVVRVSYDDMSQTARHEMKIRILDSIGCAIGAVEGSRSGTSAARSRTSAAGTTAP